ncbi:MAG: hypothetical protein HYV60_01375, partial [Planctomycetia bacterium]|nr:hypothetical protein [Planctomycetia bacterium]
MMQNKISSMRPPLIGVPAAMLWCLYCGSSISLAAEDGWRKHTVYSGAPCSTAVAADFTGDKRVDVICNAGGATRLLVAPDWTEVMLDTEGKRGLIHSETMDV